MEPRVGIVILNWNGWQDTVECLNSLQDLRYSNFEIIVVDNASTNDSVKQIRERFPHIRLIENSENGGFAKGNNLGIKAFMAAGVDYIWLLNNDTTVSTLALTEMVHLAQSDRRLGIVGSVLYEYDRPGVVQAWGGGGFNSFLATTYHSKRPMDVIGHVIGASMLVRREVIERAGMLDERFFFFMEDTEYSLRVRRAGWLLGVADKSRVYHKGGASLKKNHEIGKTLKSDILYARAVGVFMGVARMTALSVLTRLIIMLSRRLIRREFERIRPLAIAYYQGYVRGRNMQVDYEY